MLVPRNFVPKGSMAEDLFEWTYSDVVIKEYNSDTVVFEQKDVEFPKGWSDQARTITAQKYFATIDGVREHSLKQLASRVVSTMAEQGLKHGYFDDSTEANIFKNELLYIIYAQMASFNSPVWFNLGAPNHDQAIHACWIIETYDDLKKILERGILEGDIFAAGAGVGANNSNLRSSFELLSSGGKASGPVSFMKGYSAMAGVIKSGGKTRRSAKMEILDINHPDVYHGATGSRKNPDFIRCKQYEEEKAQALISAGFDPQMDGEVYSSLSHQNANHSVRVTDEFMKAVEEDRLWDLHAVQTGSVVATYPAQEIFGALAEAAWASGCPGIQFHNTINTMHTCPTNGAIRASNPCSEYLFIPFTACNLASIKVSKFEAHGSYDLSSIRHVIRILTVATDLIQEDAWYPTQQFREESLKYRTIGLGFCDLGALMFQLGIPYGSTKSVALAGALASLLTATAYEVSADIATKLGSFPNFDQDSMHKVHEKHYAGHVMLDAVVESVGNPMIHEINNLAKYLWQIVLGAKTFRNAQTSLMAPTGTIGFMLDCGTTGVEPFTAHRVRKNLAGGGDIAVNNPILAKGLMALGISKARVEEILTSDDPEQAIADTLPEYQKDVFATAFDNKIHKALPWRAHLIVMAAIQPFISGGISKTVNLPSSATPRDVASIYMEAWKLGLKAVAVYRDGAKGGQPLTTSSTKPCKIEKAKIKVSRNKLPHDIDCHRHKFTIGGVDCFLHVGEDEDGYPGEIFLRVSTLGNAVNGFAECLATIVSIAVQYGVPWETIITKFKNMEFKPSGLTSNKVIRTAKSIPDYVAQFLEKRYGLQDDVEVQLQKLAEAVAEDLGVEIDEKLGFPSVKKCPACGTPMRMLSATCHQCNNCYFSEGTCAG